jgi:branched-chain amino acid transport system permease protein
MSDEKAKGRETLLNMARMIALIISIIFLYFVPQFINEYIQFVVNTIVVYCLVAVGFNIVVGYLKHLAFANAAFFGIGAYATGLLIVHLNAPFLVALSGGAFAGAVAGASVTLPALRFAGYYLMIVTLAFTELMRWIYVHAEPVTFGATGFNVPEASILGFAFNNEERKYYLFLTVTILGLWACRRLLSSRYGRSFVAIGNNERAAAMAGIPILQRKILAFASSGFVVALAGGLFAILNGRVTPDSFGPDQTLLHFVIIMVGGLGSLLGSIMGAVLLTALPELLRNLPGLEEIALSLILIFIIFFLPRGLVSLIEKISPTFRESLHREPRRA